MTLPRTLTLPSGARVTLERFEPEKARRGRLAFEGDGPPSTRRGALFANVLGVVLSKGDVHDLPLADFHVVRAVLMKEGLVEEEEIEITCHNCGASLRVRPCAKLELGPWRDGELDDPELDHTAPFGIPHDGVTLEPRTAREALPLFEALAAKTLAIDAKVVRAMGIVKLGDLTDPAAIADALEEADDDAFASVTDVFLDAHYAPRLAADVFCTKCKARNVVDAPYEREFPRSEARTQEVTRLPPLEEFVELAHAIASPLIDEIPGEKVELVVDDGVAAVDDGGEPLLGSYVPPPPQGAPVPTQPPRVTIYYRTFEAIERDEGPYDWEGELRETIEHELEHHVYFLRGDDPMDEEEHAEIDREVVRVVGRGEATRRTLAVFGHSIPDFFVRAWPLVLIAALALVLGLAEGRCS